MNLVNKFKWLLAITIGLFMTGCSDKVDDSNLYVFKGDMVSTFLTRNSESFSKYIELAGRVHLSNKSQSTVMDLLSTRGNYTCFAPNNDALQAYVDSIMDTPNYPIEQLDDSIASFIIKNSIIDTGDDKAYETDDFVEGALTYQNLNDRYVTVTFDTNEMEKPVQVSQARISETDGCDNPYVYRDQLRAERLLPYVNILKYEETMWSELLVLARQPGQTGEYTLVHVHGRKDEHK